MRLPWFATLAWVALGGTCLFLCLPVAAIFVEAGPGELVASLGTAQARDALALSLGASTLALALIVLLGTPAAYALAMRRFRGRRLVATLVELPLVVPPAAAGVGLLAAFGPGGLLGPAIESFGVRLVFETAGVVLALCFVAAPFYVRAAQAAFEAVDPDWVEAARTLGAGEGRVFRTVLLPASRPGLAVGAGLAWGRALGEFGATLVFAGSLQGVTQTAPLAIVELLGNDFDAALALAAVLVAISATLLVGLKLITPRWDQGLGPSNDRSAGRAGG